MKNKKMTYLLIASVMGLWGLIFYRVVLNVNAGPPAVKNPQTADPAAEEKIFSVKDTFTLLLNYRDPFTGEISDEPVHEDNQALDLPASAPALKPAIVKPDHIKYTGYIMNPSSKRTVSIIAINGKEQMMTEGTTIGDVRLLKNRKDSVEVYYKGKNYFIRKS